MIGIAMTAIDGLRAVKDMIKNIKNGVDYADILERVTPSDLARMDGSLVKVLNTFIIEPTIIVSNDLKNEDITERVIDLNINIFAAFYSQVFNILTNINGVDSSIAFDILSSKSYIPGLEDLNISGRADIKNLLDDTISILPINNDNIRITMEANERTGGKPAQMAMISDKDSSIPTIISKTIDVNITIKGKGKKADEQMDYTISIPITVKSNIIYTSPNSIMNLVNVNDQSTSFRSRLEEYRSGGITGLEFLTASDLISKYKNQKLKDDDDLIQLMDDRSMAARSKYLKKGVQAGGFAEYYAMLIFSEDVKRSIEASLNGKLSKDKYSQQLLNNTKCLLASVVDRDYEHVTLYTKDLAGSSDVTFKALSKKGKTDSDSLGEILKSLMTNRPAIL